MAVAEVKVTEGSSNPVASVSVPKDSTGVDMKKAIKEALADLPKGVDINVLIKLYTDGLEKGLTLQPRKTDEELDAKRQPGFWG
jgi:hypothetical protein